jgi:hypothetical protein
MPAPDRNDPFVKAVLAEIVGIHDFFTGWFGGRVTKTEAVYARFRDALDPRFGQVNPRGGYRAHAKIVADVWDHWNWFPGDPNYRIWVANSRVRHLIGGDHALAVYEEWHNYRGGHVGRTCTALLARNPGAPTGIAWIEMHESLLPEGVKSSDDV